MNAATNDNYTPFPKGYARTEWNPLTPTGGRPYRFLQLLEDQFDTFYEDEGIATQELHREVAETLPSEEILFGLTTLADRFAAKVEEVAVEHF